MNLALVDVKNAVTTVNEAIPHTQIRVVDASFPKYVDHGAGVHSHRRRHNGTFYSHTHQHSGASADHAHSARFWKEQEVLYDVRMAFLSF